MTIVTTHYRYKRPPTRKKAVALEVPAVVAIDRKTRKRVKPTRSDDATTAAPPKPTPANDDRKPKPSNPPPPAAAAVRPSAIVTARRPGKRYAEVPEVTEEEHRRVGDLGDAMMAEFKRVIAEKVRQ
jgi:hypothetical protein